jgi:hypothetical protein
VPKRKNSSDNLSPNNIPPAVLRAVAEYTEDFRQLCNVFGEASGSLCCKQSGVNEERAELFRAWLDCHPATNKRFRDQLAQGTESSKFWAYFITFREIVAAFSIGRSAADTTQRVRTQSGDFEAKIPAGPTILDELVRISCENDLKPDPVGWAITEMEKMFQRVSVRNWVCWVFYRRRHNRSLRLPRLLRMEPVGPEPYDPAHAWDDLDEEGTDRVFKSLTNEFMRGLKERLEAATPEARKKAALHSPARSAKESEEPGGERQADEDEAKYQTQQKAVRYVRGQQEGSWINPPETIKATGLNWDTIRRKKGWKMNQKGQSLRECILKYVDQKRSKRKPRRRRK